MLASLNFHDESSYFTVQLSRKCVWPDPAPPEPVCSVLQIAKKVAGRVSNRAFSAAYDCIRNEFLVPPDNIGGHAVEDLTDQLKAMGLPTAFADSNALAMRSRNRRKIYDVDEAYVDSAISSADSDCTREFENEFVANGDSNCGEPDFEGFWSQYSDYFLKNLWLRRFGSFISPEERENIDALINAINFDDYDCYMDHVFDIYFDEIDFTTSEKRDLTWESIWEEHCAQVLEYATKVWYGDYFDDDDSDNREDVDVVEQQSPDGNQVDSEQVAYMDAPSSSGGELDVVDIGNSSCDQPPATAGNRDDVLMLPECPETLTPNGCHLPIDIESSCSSDYASCASDQEWGLRMNESGAVSFDQPIQDESKVCGGLKGDAVGSRKAVSGKRIARKRTKLNKKLNKLGFIVKKSCRGSDADDGRLVLDSISVNSCVRNGLMNLDLTFKNDDFKLIETEETMPSSSFFADGVHDPGVSAPAFTPEDYFNLVAGVRKSLQAANQIDFSNKSMRKYYGQRYRLFSKFDAGVLMDHEGWFSITPECIARHVANRIVATPRHQNAETEGVKIVVDAFCGVGGNTIQLALQSGCLVIAVDIDPVKIACALGNAELYGVADKIQFVCADFLHVALSLKADAVFLSPPWGGPDYLNEDVFDLETMTPKGSVIFKAAAQISQNIAYFVPRNTSIEQLAAVARVDKERCVVEIEQNLIGSRLKTITAYYGNLVREDCSSIGSVGNDAD